MTNLDILKNICSYFGYNYRIYNDGRVVMDNGVVPNFKSTLDWIDKSCCGHFEYNSINTALVDWFSELSSCDDAETKFAVELAFIKHLINTSTNDCRFSLRYNDKILIVCSESQEKYIRSFGCIACDDDNCDCALCDECIYSTDNIRFKRGIK